MAKKAEMAPDNVGFENKHVRSHFVSYWTGALDGPWFGVQVLVMDKDGDEWRELVMVLGSEVLVGCDREDDDIDGNTEGTKDMAREHVLQQEIAELADRVLTAEAEREAKRASEDAALQALLGDLAAVFKRHGVSIEKRTSSDEAGYFENWSLEGDGIEIELEDAVDGIAAINGE